MAKGQLKKSRLLLVEGKDEIKFFRAFFKFLKIDNIDVEEVKGKQNFKAELPLLKARPGFNKIKKIGLIRDADEDFSATMDSVFDRLVDNGYKPVKKHNQFSEEIPQIGIFIMPGKNKKGSLENLCLEAVKNEPEFDCINDFIECIDEKKLKKIAKRKTQVYLTTKPKLVNSLGLGAANKYWNFKSSFYDNLKKFIAKLSS